MSWKEGCSHGGQDKTTKHSYWKNICLDLVSVYGIRGAKNNALNLVVYSTTGPEINGLWIAGKVMKVGLEEPECLRASV
jgi:hypothetical protein